MHTSGGAIKINLTRLAETGLQLQSESFEGGLGEGINSLAAAANRRDRVAIIMLWEKGGPRHIYCFIGLD